MSDWKRIAPWILAGVAAVMVIAWAFPRAFPFLPPHWTTTPAGAEAIALERLAELGELPADPLVVTDLDVGDGMVERRLITASAEVPVEELARSELARRVLSWRVTVYPEGALPGDWTHRAQVAVDGSVLSLVRRIEPDEERPAIRPGAAIAQADRFLAARGVDLERYERPEVRSRELDARTDLEVRYRSEEELLDPRVAYGLQVDFAGDEIAGFAPWIEDPAERELQAVLQPFAIWSQFQLLSIFLIAPLIAILFLRRYHAGEVGVSQGGRIFVAMFSASVVVIFTVALAVTEGQNWGFLSRSQVAWQWGAQFLVIFFLPLALVAFLSWSVGESLCRRDWTRKLAAFDSLVKGEWGNATVARGAVRGAAAGLVLLAVCLGASVLLAPLGVMPQVFTLVGSLVGFKLAGPLPGLTIVLFSLLLVLYRELFGRLFLVSWAVRRAGAAMGTTVAVLVAAVALFPAWSVLPLEWAVGFWLVQAAVLVALFLGTDLLTVLVASAVVEIGIPALPLVFSEAPSLQVQGWLALAVPFVPALVALRQLGSGREFHYRYDDIPPHVRRIAERERQRVELETARRIQSSILPELPPRLAGLEIAHAYLPASEVGGDFYDVFALGDGRLAVAVGDVAGHGVSSGLVMAAVKSALAVQATFDPEVEPVFQTLNRMVFQSARRRLITTLCYCLIDPAGREMFFASAGHIFPYRVSADGRIDSLPSISYPLGVRPEMEVAVARERLDPGDTLVLLSDGIVEARPEGSTDLYGFDRLEASLARHAGESVEGLCHGVLADLSRFVGPSPREDDQTLLVLRLAS